MSNSEFRHESVLCHEVVEHLSIKPTGIYVDGTAGGGGHAAEVLVRLGEQGKLVLCDQDNMALQACQQRFSGDERVIYIQTNFCNLQSALESFAITAVDGILLDLGVSSPQIDRAERGFSYHHDGPLDMRMDKGTLVSAADIVNGYSIQQLTKIIASYGEERFAGRIAAHIVAAREKQLIGSTVQLAEIIKNAIPAATRRSGPHPARRTFQALRIAVNNELSVLETVLPQCVELLKVGGRLCVITFHSLEDRIVKRFFRQEAQACLCPPGFPVCMCNNRPRLKLIGGGYPPQKEEQNTNKRARSAKLRVAERRD